MCVHHKERKIRTYIHGDDFVSSAEGEELAWMKKELERRYELKTHVLGPDENMRNK